MVTQPISPYCAEACSDLCKVCKHQRAPTWGDGAWVKGGSQYFKQRCQDWEGLWCIQGTLDILACVKSYVFGGGMDGDEVANQRNS